MKSDSANYCGFNNSTLRLSGAVLLTNTFGTRLLQSSAASRLDGPLNTALALVFKAMLAGRATFAGMAFDIADGVKAFNQKKWSIAAVYFVRATAQLSAAFFSAAIGLAAAAPYLERLIQIHGRNRFLVFTHQKSTQLALKMAFMLRWCIRINLVIFAASVALEMLLPNELQNYLNHCTFRKDRSNGTPESVEQELKNFHKPIETTL
ncbi:hypothetical protein BSF44_40650 [Pseudomonas sp. ACN8]|uniref:hypothetical protein n=1 Tax=Pseudomonas sp. ACN8 TaxID=1920428 RepID=UPI000BB3A80B|nr:hypothetical protein [Pseudomonas sp. ACN8]PBJ20388.1 hypothetical protein BSF44_40650 [Pseudomonas sp. ACN8]